MLRCSDEIREFRYEVRDEAEQTVKDLNIDRANFHEAPKNEWENVIKRFYYTFIDYKKYPEITLNYFWLRFRDDLVYSHTQHWYHNGDWEEFLGYIDKLIPKKSRSNEYYYINNCGWVYEGKLPEIIKVLGDCTGRVEDFYIIPKRKRFGWAVCYCGDGDCMGVYLRG